VKILIAEDDPISMLVLRRAVEKLGHECVTAADGTEAWALFQETPFDVVVSDWLMPGIEGIELCRRIRAVEAGSYTYFVFMTALGGKQNFLAGMRAGADDYLSKPFDLDELEARLIAASRVTSLHRKLRDQNAELERLIKSSFEVARTDPLTGVGNRLRLREDLEAIGARVERYGHRYCAALCDLDHFKKYNDSHGHLAGDEALRAVAQALVAGLRKGDAVYRYGGEEFLAILAEQTLDGAGIAMDRVRLAVEQLAIPHRGKTPPGVVTMSAGLATLDAADAAMTDAWLNRADEALYCAKATGRNRVVACDTQVDGPPTLRAVPPSEG
jgi:two-component system, cell cycle response regulator